MRAAVVVVALAACSGDPAHFDVRGTIDGLDGGTVTIAAGDVSTTSGDGDFELVNALVEGKAYEIRAENATGSHACTIAEGSGTAKADIEGLVVHCASTDATLLGLEMSAAPLHPAFAFDTLAYLTDPVVVSGIYAPATTTVLATAASEHATITVAGVPVTSGMPSSAIALPIGHSSIDVVVTAGDGTTKTTYSIDVVGVVAHYVKASTTRASLGFGWSIAVTPDGSRMVVGAPGESSNATGVNGDQTDSSLDIAGAAYVFDRDGIAWKQTAYLKASNSQYHGRFGETVAIAADGKTIAIASPWEASNATGIDGDQTNRSMQLAGAAYVFVENGGAWSQQAYVKGSFTHAGDLFGTDVALSADGNVLLVGAEGEGNPTTADDGTVGAVRAGAAYVFERDAMATPAWSQRAYVKPPHPRTNTQFGVTVAISADGNTLAIGADAEDSDATGIGGDDNNAGANDSGAVFVYQRGTQYTLQAYLKASNSKIGFRFGSAIALSADGNKLVIGAPFEDTMFNESGAAFVFTRASTTWTQQPMLKPAVPHEGGLFGKRVALRADGQFAVSEVNDPSNATNIDGNANDASLSNAGGAYLFGADRAQKKYVKSPRTAAQEHFGEGLAVSDHDFLVGVPRERGSGTGVNPLVDATLDDAGCVFTY